MYRSFSSLSVYRCLGILLLGGCTLAQANTWTVTTGGSGTCTSPDFNCASLAAAINAVNSTGTTAQGQGDTILFETGVTTVQAPTDGYFISKNVVIDGSPNGVTVQGNGSSQTTTIFYNGSSATTTLRLLTISNGQGTVAVSGLAVHNDGNLTINQVTVTGNDSGTSRNSVGNSGTLTIRYSSINGNTGEGIYNNSFGTLLIDHSTVVNNTASGTVGGGIFNQGNATVRNSTIAFNHANSGGGIFQDGASSMMIIDHSTIAYNQATEASSGRGGGIYVAGTTGTVTLYSSIVAGNTSAINDGPDIFNSATLTSLGYNLVGNTQNANTTFTTGDLQNVAANFADTTDVADHGGPTPTLALLSSSPALAAGNCAAVTGQTTIPAATTDQRDYSRPATLCDIGAFEETIFRGTFESL